MKKVGLFFGSFNPIHVGHLIIANYMVETSDLAEVWFVISPQNPFKEKKSLLDQRHRLYMVNLAVEDNYKLRASDIEFNLPVPSYTIDTLTHLRERYSDYSFVLLMGGDNLQSLHKWKNYELILNNYEIFVYPRPGSTEKAELQDHPNVHLLPVPLLDISASFIRRSLAEGRSVQYLVTEPVLKHLDEMKFYT